MKMKDYLDLSGKIANRIAVSTRALLSLLLLVFSAYSTADDLEIYSGLVDSSVNPVIHPGVLFILDSSGSMNEDVSNKTGAQKKNHLLEDTMVKLLEGIVGSDTKIGLSRYNGTGHGGSIIYPVTEIGAMASSLDGGDEFPGNSGDTFAEGSEMIKLAKPRDDYWDKTSDANLFIDYQNKIGFAHGGSHYYVTFYNLPIARNSKISSGTRLLLPVDGNPAGIELSNKPPRGIAPTPFKNGTSLPGYFSEEEIQIKVLRNVNPLRAPEEKANSSTYKASLRSHHDQQFSEFGTSEIVTVKTGNAVVYDGKIWLPIGGSEFEKLLNDLVQGGNSDGTLWRMRNYNSYHRLGRNPGNILAPVAERPEERGDDAANGVLFQITFPSSVLRTKAGNNSVAFTMFPPGINKAAENRARVMAPRLEFRYAKSVRQRLIEMTAHHSPHNSIEGTGGTPILESLVESYYYWSGQDVHYGKTRGESNAQEKRQRSHVSHRGALTGEPSTRNIPQHCTIETYYRYECEEESFASATYESPIASCNNTQVLLTDGAPTFNDDAERIKVDQLVIDAGFPSCRTGTSTSNTKDRVPQAECIAALSEYMSNIDLDSTNSGVQVVNTSVIAFGEDFGKAAADISKNKAILRDVAEKGQGKYFEASDADALLAALQSIVVAGAVRPPSIAGSVITADAQNSLRTRSKVYLSQFQPADSRSWEGNIKQYLLCIDAAISGCSAANAGQLVDANGDPVYEKITKSDGSSDFKIRSGTQSLWSATADVEVTEGGTGAKLRDAAPRQLYIGDALSSYRYPANWNNSALRLPRTAICGGNDNIPLTVKGERCKRLMQALLSNETGGNRWMHRDVVHSAPASIYYGNTSTGDPIYKVLYGTNDGILHFVSDDSGEEEWGFLPDRFLRQQASVINGSSNTGSATEHTYGFDLTPTVLIKNPDGEAITPSSTAGGDSVWAFVGLRRGGSALYAFDLTGSTPLQNQTDSVVPVIKWVIEKDSGDFERLGLTFSQPTTAKMMVDGTLTDVLVFGGGYDKKLDDVLVSPTTANPAFGNAVYIVDAYEEGTLLYSFSSGDDSKMIHSVPSAIAVIDSDGNGVDDRLYFGDTGGQVWRIDVESLSKNSANNDVRHGLLASLSGSGNTDRRRFFEPPIVVPVKDARYSTKSVYDYILIGSGNRARPVGDSATIDHFYAIRDYQTGQLPAAYPTKNNSQSTGSITTADLVDITSATFVDATSGGDSTEGKAAKNKDGWYFTMDGTEKVFSPAAVSPVRISNRTHAVVYVTSYVPPAPRASSCAAVSVGSSNERSFDLMSTQAVIIDSTGNASLKPAGNRKTVIGSGLIPGSTGTPQSTKKIGRLLPGATGVQNVQTKPITRTYWYSD